MTEVRVTIPQSYYAGTPAMTKAPLNLDESMIRTLPAGSTLWLSYQEVISEGVYGAAEVKPYIVKNSNTYVGLYPCEIQEIEKNGAEYISIDTTRVGAPLFLTSGKTYHFKGMYPALDLRKDNLECEVSNGTWVCTNDRRYSETMSIDVPIVASEAKVTYIQLQPLVNQTARLHFKITKGANIHSLEMMHSGIEIAGVQNKYKVENLDWLNEASHLEVKPVKQEEGEHWYKLHEFRTDADMITGDAYLLPLDASRTYIIILVNIAVNGIPTQYVTTLNSIIFEHGRSYNLDMEVRADGNMSVINWQNSSWVVEPEKIIE